MNIEKQEVTEPNQISEEERRLWELWLKGGISRDDLELLGKNRSKNKEIMPETGIGPDDGDSL